METRSKRRRMLQSYVSSQWSDLPAIFDSLNDDTLTAVLEFLGNKSYRSLGGVNKRCREVYLNTPGMTKETFLFGYGSLADIRFKTEGVGFECELLEAVGKGVVCFNRNDVFNWALEERKLSLLKEICYVAVKEGRVDILVEVLNNVNNEDAKRDIFYHVDRSAASHGKLDVLKLLDSEGLYINKDLCDRIAAIHGHLHILKWLKEEKGFQLNEQLYNYAIQGGHLHVMKWLSEQRVDWGDCTFPCAAKKGNLEALQWLHDEGCPWPEDPRHRVYEHLLEPDVIEWLRTNGFDNRIQLQ